MIEGTPKAQPLKDILFRVALKRLFWLERYAKSEMIPTYRPVQRLKEILSVPRNIFKKLFYQIFH